MINIEGLVPGKKVVIIGSGDIGLIMARRFVLEGAEVKAVIEIIGNADKCPKCGNVASEIVFCRECGTAFCE